MSALEVSPPFYGIALYKSTLTYLLTYLLLNKQTGPLFHYYYTTTLTYTTANRGGSRNLRRGRPLLTLFLSSPSLPYPYPLPSLGSRPPITS